MDENIIPQVLRGNNGKVLLFALGGILIMLLVYWVVTIINRSGDKTVANTQPQVVDVPLPNVGGNNSTSGYNSTEEGRQNAKNVAQKIFNHLKNGWTFGGWVCASPVLVPSIIDALSQSSDAYIRNVGQFYAEIDPNTKISQLLEQTPCQSTIGREQKKQLINRLKTLSL